MTLGGRDGGDTGLLENGRCSGFRWRPYPALRRRSMPVRRLDTCTTKEVRFLPESGAKTSNESAVRNLACIQTFALARKFSRSAALCGRGVPLQDVPEPRMNEREPGAAWARSSRWMQDAAAGTTGAGPGGRAHVRRCTSIWCPPRPIWPRSGSTASSRTRLAPRAARRAPRRRSDRRRRGPRARRARGLPAGIRAAAAARVARGHLETRARPCASRRSRASAGAGAPSSWRRAARVLRGLRARRPRGPGRGGRRGEPAAGRRVRGRDGRDARRGDGRRRAAAPRRRRRVLPAIRVGRLVFSGEDRLNEAAAAAQAVTTPVRRSCAESRVGRGTPPGTSPGGVSRSTPG